MIGAHLSGSTPAASAHATAPSWQQAGAAVQLMRPTNALPAAVLVLAGAHLLDAGPLSPAVWWSAAAMVCITAHGYVANDLADLTEDRINKPNRPLPSGHIAVSYARVLALCLALAGLACAAAVSALGLVTAAAVTALLHFYNLRLKATPGYGNTLIGLLAGAALVSGGVAAAGLNGTVLRTLLLPALSLVLFIAAREALKTLEDMPGDRAAGKQTLALRFGAQSVPRLLIVLAWISTAVMVATKIQLGYSGWYPVVAGAGVLLPLHAAGLDLLHHCPPARARRWLVVLKGSYAAGIIALFVA